jgi:hypothetical protein
VLGLRKVTQDAPDQPTSLVSFRIEGEYGLLDGSKISPDGATVAAFLSSEVSYGDLMVSGLDGPQDLPLSG